MVQGMYNPSGFRIGGMICGSVHVQPIIVRVPFQIYGLYDPL